MREPALYEAAYSGIGLLRAVQRRLQGMKPFVVEGREQLHRQIGTGTAEESVDVLKRSVKIQPVGRERRVEPSLERQEGSVVANAALTRSCG